MTSPGAAIDYRTSLDGVTSEMLQGFFIDWPNPPSPETHLRLLHNSSHVVLALDPEQRQVVGFVTAISDGVLSAYIPLLEVLPAYQGRGIGSALITKMLDQLKHFYMVDLTCEAELVPYYQRFGMRASTAMIHRSYENQAGITESPGQENDTR